MRDMTTLSTLPTDAQWQFRTQELAVLCERDTPVVICVYGAVKEAKIYDKRGVGIPKIQLWLWSATDVEKAAALFGSSKPGKSTCTRSE